MGKVQNQKLQDLWPQYNNGHLKNEGPWIIDEDHENCWINVDAASSSSSSLASSVIEASTISDGSCSSNDTRDDASSSATHSSSSNSSGALYDLSELMEQLPIKVTSIEDLAKKEAPCRRKHKGSKNFEGGLDAYRTFTLPKPIISKKTPRGSLSSSFLCRRGGFINGSSRPPQKPLKKSLGDGM
ncbi:uncharacterized protein [Coffea arabica]|uniref:Uncharacterized protein isoform X3 n=1 Tax=Coffea arabica TaxID=13443 RepID=A0A6P6XKD6_COFAR|nr:uncharacterized protein LOC113742766 isoform X2 [Coffea arabica]